MRKKDTNYYTLTSPAGRFIFPKCTYLVHAKLIRDTITAGFFGTIDGTAKPKDRPQRAANIHHWLKSMIGGPAAENSFKWERA